MKRSDNLGFIGRGLISSYHLGAIHLKEPGKNYEPMRTDNSKERYFLYFPWPNRLKERWKEAAASFRGDFCEQQVMLIETEDGWEIVSMRDEP